MKRYLPSVGGDLLFIFSVVVDVDRHEDGHHKCDEEEYSSTDPEVCDLVSVYVLDH